MLFFVGSLRDTETRQTAGEQAPCGAPPEQPEATKHNKPIKRKGEPPAKIAGALREQASSRGKTGNEKSLLGLALHPAPPPRAHCMAAGRRGVRAGGGAALTAPLPAPSIFALQRDHCPPGQPTPRLPAA